MHFWEECVDSVRFLGLMLITLFRVLIRPRRLRWNAIFHHMEEAGIDAIPLVVVLSFFIGMVLAFMSARLLGQFGASLLTVDLVSIAMLREFGVVMTAIILAGRSNSAFTAQIGAMRMQREVDAMQVMGVDPFEALVIPRLIATMVMVPLLSVVAMASGIVGGMLVAWNAFDLSPILFFARMQEVVPVSNFWVGIAKAPVFGLVMALVGCRQGMLVGGTVASLGQRTTSSVVQAIFLVIVIDALFAILYLEMDV
jgi:phospholipid/cholesterol/gamma-HCH transport system permease protein